MDVWGLLAIVVFYLMILGVGMWAARKSSKEADSEDVMLAGRSIGLVVGIFTMTATWVGGGYINGTAEMVYKSGLVWCQAPFGYALSLVFGGVLFAERMRQQGYVTMLDPFQIKYGQRMGGLLFIPALLGEVFWSAAILAALGATLSVILDIPDSASVIISACIAVFYTYFGGLYAVAYTDVVQLFCIFIGLDFQWICIPPALQANATTSIIETAPEWISELSGVPVWSQWIDCGLLLVFGGIPWQVYFQRVLSSRDPLRAKMLSYVAAIGCLLMAIPPVIIGAIAKSTDWSQTPYRPYPEPNDTLTSTFIIDNQTKMVLPLVLRHLTPWYVSFVGLGAVSAAVMSSADSSILSAASMFARNIWKLAIRPHASEGEIIQVMRVAIVIVGVLATVMALVIETIYGLWYLCADLVYVILFPQLLCVVYMDKSNVYGSLAGYLVGFFLRIIGGEPLLFLPALVHFPWFGHGGPLDKAQYFPFRTLAMLSSLATVVGVSHASDHVFRNRLLPPSMDILHCVINLHEDHQTLKYDPSFATSTDTLMVLNVHGAASARGSAVSSTLNGGGWANPGGPKLSTQSNSPHENNTTTSLIASSPNALMPPDYNSICK